MPEEALKALLHFFLWRYISFIIVLYCIVSLTVSDAYR